jgi:chromosome segregation ATPase
MKKIILMVAVTTFMAGTTLVSCKSNSEKEGDAEKNVQEANQDLNQVQNDAKADAATKATDAEWQTFKTETEASISANDMRIADLKKAMKKPGTTFDANYAKSIDALEERNKALAARVKDYENNQTDWESFKREFDSDMKGLGEAFKDLTVNNKK